MRARRLLAASVCAAASLACPGSRERFSADTVAVIDARPVLLSSFRAYFESNAGRPIAESSPKVVSALFDEFLREETWRREAKLHSSDAQSDRRQAPALLLARAGVAVVATDTDVEAEYDRHPERYRRPEEARVARIFVRDRAGAEQARARVLHGEDFDKVAKEVSQSPDAAAGGDMGYVRRGDLPSAFESVVFRLGEGDVSAVMASEEGFLVFELEKKEPARQLTPEEAAPEIRRTLSRTKASAYLDGIVERARREGRLRILEDRLPFVYTGNFATPRG